MLECLDSACFNMIGRLMPMSPAATIRTLDEDLELHGYRIPKGVSFLLGFIVVRKNLPK